MDSPPQNISAFLGLRLGLC